MEHVRTRRLFNCVLNYGCNIVLDCTGVSCCLSFPNLDSHPINTINTGFRWCAVYNTGRDNNSIIEGHSLNCWRVRWLQNPVSLFFTSLTQSDSMFLNTTTMQHLLERGSHVHVPLFYEKQRRSTSSDIKRGLAMSCAMRLDRLAFNSFVIWGSLKCMGTYFCLLFRAKKEINRWFCFILLVLRLFEKHSNADIQRLIGRLDLLEKSRKPGGFTWI